MLAVGPSAVVLWGAWNCFASNFSGCTQVGCQNHVHRHRRSPDREHHDNGTIGPDRDGSISIDLGNEERPTTSAATVAITATAQRRNATSAGCSSKFSSPTHGGPSPPISALSRCNALKPASSRQLAAVSPAASHALSSIWPITSTDWAPAMA